MLWDRSGGTPVMETIYSENSDVLQHMINNPRSIGGSGHTTKGTCNSMF